MLFPTGRIRWTRAVLTHDKITTDDLVWAFSRFIRGDWGDLDEVAKMENDLALTSGEPVMGVYTSQAGARFCISTRNGRTLVSLLCEEEASGVLAQPHPCNGHQSR
ncbi:MAG: hypothetical protein K6T63_12685 [Alicyclobacillus herbarius]|uniref:hypothetical protein n=1 Tax=Alicyclobacillus herbarius TaxID=122960 RepID=UPI0005507D6E|nr:hypothetical protein [Alicyclobacillus herbarius]MCL6633473.1 hypothetical protein [Alicyclobacillus herbarius]